MFTLKPDFETTYQRIEAFWRRTVIDRPVTMFTLFKPPEEQIPLPESNAQDSAGRWLDTEYQTELAAASLRNQLFLGDTLPIAWPNLGPEVFASFYGCPIHFGDYGTSWTDPILESWDEADRLQLDWDSPILRKLEEMTDALLEAGKDTFLVGMTDWHPGGDALAAFRDPQRLAMDLVEHTEAVLALLQRIETDYFAVYDHFYARLRQSGQPITSWTPLLYMGKYYIPSNDFSIMISKRLFDEVFLPGIRRECQFLDRSIYHLDGPGALRHLDSLLAIPELDAVQFVPGAGNEVFSRWVEVYRKIQAAGKGIQVGCRFNELDAVMEALQPQGLFLSVSGVPDRPSAEAMLGRLERWTKEARR
jgi:hypothetical protein